MNINTAVILAAGKSNWYEKPMGFLEIRDTTIIDRMITVLNSYGIDNIIIITGYKKDMFEELSRRKNVKLIYNDRYKWTGTMYSLSLACEEITSDFILIEGDMVFEEIAIEKLLKSDKENTFLITSESGTGDEDLIELDGDNNIFRISKDIHQLNRIDGEFIGLSKISHNTYNKVMESFKHNNNPYLNYEYAIINYSCEYNIGYIRVDDLVWCDIDTYENYENLKKIIYPKLLRKEINIKKEMVKKISSEILNVDPSYISDIERLGGLTNKNYKVKIGNDYFVVRLPGNGTERFIDRSNEKYNSNIAYKLNLDSETIYFDEIGGLKITRFIKDAETMNPATSKKEENMELMANALCKLHKTKEKFYSNFNPFEKIEFYEKCLIESNRKLFDDYYDLRKVFIKFERELNELGIDNTPCHIDPLAENFIKSGNDKIYIIDWEYSGNYDSLWDIAAVCSECNYSEDEEELFISKYKKRDLDEVESKKLIIHKVIQDMFWYLWGMAKVAKGDDYLYNWACDKYNNGKRNIKKYIALYGEVR